MLNDDPLILSPPSAEVARLSDNFAALGIV